MSEQTIYCSFCGKSQHDVRAIIAGEKAHICDECVDLCAGICAESRAKKRRAAEQLADIRRNGT